MGFRRGGLCTNFVGLGTRGFDAGACVPADRPSHFQFLPVSHRVCLSHPLFSLSCSMLPLIISLCQNLNRACVYVVPHWAVSLSSSNVTCTSFTTEYTCAFRQSVDFTVCVPSDDNAVNRFHLLRRCLLNVVAFFRTRDPPAPSLAGEALILAGCS